MAGAAGRGWISASSRIPRPRHIQYPVLRRTPEYASVPDHPAAQCTYVYRQPGNSTTSLVGSLDQHLF